MTLSECALHAICNLSPSCFINKAFFSYWLYSSSSIVVGYLRSILLSLLAVEVCVLVLWPRTGRPIACLLPRYAPISFSRLICSCTTFRASDPIVIWPSSAVNDVTVRGASEPTLASLCIECLAMTLAEESAPSP